MVAQGMPVDDATEFLSTIIGALVVANALRDSAEYDRATTAFRLEEKSAA